MSAAPLLPVAGSSPLAATPDLWLPQPFLVRVYRRETADTFSIGLVPQAGGPPLRFRPGQFNMLLVPGVGEAAISISGDPTRPGLLWHTIRAVGGVTGQLLRIRRGDYVGVRGPFGVPWPVDDLEGRDLVLVAGGIGLAPLRPVLCHVLRHRRRYGRVTLLYGARSPGDVLFQRDLTRFRSLPRGRGLQVEVTVDHADAAWRGDVGLVTRLITRAAIDPLRTTALLCGPEVMMRSVRADLAQLGMADRDIFVTLERHMKCGIGLCGRCQLGPLFICKDGPVFAFDTIRNLFETREL